MGELMALDVFLAVGIALTVNVLLIISGRLDQASDARKGESE